MLLDKEREKIHRSLSQFINEWVNSGVSIISDDWTNVIKQHLINVLGVLRSGTVFFVVDGSSSITSCPQNITDHLLKKHE